MENLPSPALVAAAENCAAVFMSADIYYRDNGGEALILVNGSPYVIAVDESGPVQSTYTEEWRLFPA